MSTINKDSLIINPDLLLWARKSIGLGLEESAKKLGIKIDLLEAWESGEAIVPTNKLRKLSEVYKRPSAVFLLNKAPDEKLITEFRKLFESRESILELTKDTLLLIRRAFRIQRILTEDFEFGTNPTVTALRSQKNGDIKAISSKIADLLSIDYSEVTQHRDMFSQLNLWKKLIEAHNIVVIESGFPKEEARGFVIQHPKVPIIVLNIKDSPYARIFTLLHELGHLIIGKDSVDGSDTLDVLKHSNKEEVFCNELAGNVLVPTNLLLEKVKTNGLDLKTNLNEAVLKLSKSFNISVDVIARRLHTLSLLSDHEYSLFLKNRSVFEKKITVKKRSGGDFYKNFVKHNGITFVMEVINAFNGNKISFSESLDYLNMKPKTFEKLLPKVLSNI